jgi:hypothetical protein
MTASTDGAEDTAMEDVAVGEETALSSFDLV